LKSNATKAVDADRMMRLTLWQTRGWFGLRGNIAQCGGSCVLASRSTSFDVHATVPVGKHKGKTYEDVMKNEPTYTNWLRGQDRDKGPLAPFIVHLNENQGAQVGGQSAGDLGKEELKFGKHKGKTFEAILAEDPSYASFVRRAVKDEGSGNRQMQRFADFLAAQQVSPAATSTPERSSPSALGTASWTLKLGKHKGKSFQEVYEEDQKYCAWAIQTAASGEAKGSLGSFAEYVKARGVVPAEAATASTSSQGHVAQSSSASSGSKKLSFGKHMGKTYEEVANQQKPYCDWVLKSVAEGSNRNPQVTEFAQYIKSRAESPNASPVQVDVTGASELEATEREGPLPIDEYKIVEGLHKGRSFKDVFEQEQDYCRWLVEHHFDNGVPGTPMWHFIAYTLNRWRNGENAPPTLDD